MFYSTFIKRHRVQAILFFGELFDYGVIESRIFDRLIIINKTLKLNK